MQDYLRTYLPLTHNTPRAPLISPFIFESGVSPGYLGNPSQPPFFLDKKHPGKMASLRVKPERLSSASGSPSIESEAMAPRAVDTPPEMPNPNDDGPKAEQPRQDPKTLVLAPSIPKGPPAKSNKRDLTGKQPLSFWDARWTLFHSTHFGAVS